MTITCISCGMPMETSDQHAAGDESKDYCLYCAYEDGSLKSYADALDGMTDYIARTEEVDHGVARIRAKEYMKSMPAWKDKGMGGSCGCCSC